MTDEQPSTKNIDLLLKELKEESLAYALVEACRANPTKRDQAMREILARRLAEVTPHDDAEDQEAPGSRI